MGLQVLLTSLVLIALHLGASDLEQCSDMHRPALEKILEAPQGEAQPKSLVPKQPTTCNVLFHKSRHLLSTYLTPSP